MITAGIDMGSKTIKVVIVKDGKIIGKAIELAGFESVEAAEKAFAEALEDAGITKDDIENIIATGAGRKNAPYTDRDITEVGASTRGATNLYPAARTVIDVGAEEGRAIRITPDGKVMDFAINEKCAAGAGAFTESMSRALEVPIEELGALSLKSTIAIPMNAQCAVFAESEVVTLVHSKTSKEDIARAVHDAIASRIVSLARKVGFAPEVILIGGVAFNTGFVDSLERALETKVIIPDDPEFIGAYGAALIAAEGDPMEISWESPAAETTSEKKTTQPVTQPDSTPAVPPDKDEKAEYWRWKEYNWHDENIDWRDADLVTAGVDVGSVSSQTVIVVDGKLYAFSNMRTGSSSPESATNAMNWALEGTGLTLDDIGFVVGTGYGRVNVPFSKKAITEIACHARGANFMYGPAVRTVLDMGGQDCKVIRCDERGKVTAFAMNDKCAAGTGRGMEVFADLLAIPIEDVGEMSLDVEEEPPPVSSTCVVFAKSEATGLLREGWPKSKVLAAYCSAMAHRVVTLLEQVGVEKEFAITGGIAKNIGVVQRICKEVDLESLTTEYDTQIAGALGGALFAQNLLKKKLAKAGK